MHSGDIGVIRGEEPLGPADQHLAQFETEDRRIESVETGPMVFHLVDQGVEEFVLPSLLVPKDELLGPFVQHQLPLQTLHTEHLVPLRLSPIGPDAARPPLQGPDRYVRFIGPF